MLEKIKIILDKHQNIKRTLLFIYKITLNKYFSYKENKHFKKYSESTLHQLKKAFSELNVDYWLDFGTLLGAVRDKDFIEHDNDIDLGMWLSDYSPNLDLVLEKYGFKKTREIKIDNGEYGLELTYQFNKINVDIFFYTKIDSQIAYYHDFIPEEGMSRSGTIKKHGGLISREIYLPISKIGEITFKNDTYPIPEPTIDHLIGRYGKNYHIKDSNWNITKGNKDSVKILEKVGIITRY